MPKMFLYCTMVVLFLIFNYLIYCYYYFPIVAKSKDDTQYKKLVAFASLPLPQTTSHPPRTIPFCNWQHPSQHIWQYSIPVCPKVFQKIFKWMKAFKLRTSKYKEDSFFRIYILWNFVKKEIIKNYENWNWFLGISIIRIFL